MCICEVHIFYFYYCRIYFGYFMTWEKDWRIVKYILVKFRFITIYFFMSMKYELLCFTPLSGHLDSFCIW